MTRSAPRLDRRALFASGAAAALLAASGMSAMAAPRRGGRLRIALSGARRDDSFDARKPMGVFMQVAMLGAVFDTLTQVAADGTLHGELATGWHGSSDARVWVFDLRRDARFHNEAVFTSQDVIASLALHTDAALAGISDMRAIGRHRVEVTLSQGNADFPYTLSAPQFVIYPEAGMADAMAEGIGTGLYRVDRFHPGQQFLGSRVAQHYKDGQAGWFDTVELVSVPAAHVRAEALRDHYVDVADLDDPGELLGQPDITLLPNAHAMTQAAWRTVALPATIGSRWPLDNLRAAERWWMA